MQRSGGASGSSKESTKAAGQLLCIPHVNTLTKSGKPNFSDPADAICELVDNGMQASMGIEGLSRRVDVYVFQPDPLPMGSRTQPDPTLLVIRDNGQGMDTNTLAAYFTYFQGQKERGLAPEEVCSGAGASNHLTSTISKFGVGATQAGFYLAHTITVISKYRGDGVVRWVSVAEKELDRNQEELPKDRAADVYKIPFFQGRNATEALPSLWKRCQPLMELCQEVSKEPHFSLIVLPLRPSQMKALGVSESKRGGVDGYDGKRVARALAHTYYYYLNPTQFPKLKEGKREELGQLYALGKGPPKRGGGSGRSTPVGGGEGKGKARASSGTSTPDVTSPEALQLHMDLLYFKSWGVSFAHRGAACQSYSLASLECLEQDYLKDSAAEPFTFTLEVPLAKEAGGQVAVPDSAEVVEAPTTTLYGVLRYYGFEDYRESHPLATVTGSPEQRVLDVRWMGRLLPEAVVNRLHFFPPPSSKLQRTEPERAAKLGPWERRVHGCLFLNQWDVGVSYNKLKLLQGGAESLEDVLCSDKTKSNKHDRSLPTRFEAWLAACHLDVDKEQQLEGEKRIKDRKTYWERVRYSESERDVFRRTDPLPIRLFKPAPQSQAKAKQGPGRKKGEQGTEVYAQVLDFMVKQVIEAPTYSGDEAVILYKRMPEEVYGSAKHELPLHCLDPSKARMSAEEWDRCLNQQRKLQPHTIQVLECTANSTSAAPVLKETSDNYLPLCPRDKHPWQAGEWLPKLGVKLIDGHGHNIHEHNQNTRNYFVHERVSGPLGFQTRDFVAELKKEFGGAYYLHLGSESCPLDLVGTYSLSLWVTNEEGQRLKIPREVVLTYVTQSGTPTYFDVPDLPNGVAASWCSVKLSSSGSRLPAFSLFARDPARICTSANLKVWWEVLGEEGEEAPPFHVAYRPGRNDPLQPLYEGPISSEGLFFNKKAPWLLLPGASFGQPYTGPPLLDASAFATRPLLLALHVCVVEEDGEESPLYLDSNDGHEDRLLLKLMVEPGEPNLQASRFQGLPRDKTLRLHDGDTIPQLLLQLKDWNGNTTTAAQGVNWKVTLSSPLLAPPAAPQTSHVFKVDGKGDCPIHGLQVQMPEGSWGEGDVSSKAGSLLLVFEADNLKGTLSTELSLSIKPATTPHGLHLYYKGTRLDLPGPAMEWQRFLPLRPLVLRVVSRSGHAVPSLPTDVSLTTSWADPNEVIPKMEDEGLELGEGELRLDSPVLVLDCVKSKEFRVTASHPSFAAPLVCSFRLKPLPGPAAGWCVRWSCGERPHASTLRMGAALGPFTITQTDQGGMSIHRAALQGLVEGQEGWPLIEINSDSPAKTFTVDPPGLSLSFSEALQGWTTTHKYTFTGPKQTLRLSVRDVGERLRTGDLRIVLQAGRAEEVRMESESLGLSMAVGEEGGGDPVPTITTPPGTTVRDLRVCVRDAGGHNAAYLETNTTLQLLYMPPTASSSASSASSSSDAVVVLSTVVFTGKKSSASRSSSPPPSAPSTVDRETATALLPPFVLPPMPAGQSPPLTLYVRLTPPVTSHSREVLLPGLRYVPMLTNRVTRAEAILCTPLAPPPSKPHKKRPLPPSTDHQDEEEEKEEEDGDSHSPYVGSGGSGSSSGSGSSVGFRVDEAWPCVAVRLVTEDGRPLRPRPSPEQLRMGLRSARAGRGKDREGQGQGQEGLLDKAFDSQWTWGRINGQADWIILTPKPLPPLPLPPADLTVLPEAPPLPPGRFELDVSYLETRPHLLSSSSSEGGGEGPLTSLWQALGVSLRFKLLSGPPYRLMATSTVAKRSLTNRPDHPSSLLFPSRPSRAGGLELAAADVYGFPATPPSAPCAPRPLTLTLRANASHPPTTQQLQQGKTIPALQPIAPVAPSKWGVEGWRWEVEAKAVALDSSHGGANVMAQGELELVASVEGLVQWTTDFSFTTDHIRQEQIHKLEEELQLLQPQLDNCDGQLSSATQHHRHAEAQLQQLLTTAVLNNQHLRAAFFRPDGSLCALPSREARRALALSLDQQQQRLAAPPRPLRVPNNFPSSDLVRACRDDLGLGSDPAHWPSICRLGFVTDPTLARVLSWAAGEANMGSLLLQTKAQQNLVVQVRRRDVQCYARDLMRPFSPTRPGPLPLSPQPSNYPGFVGSAVNLIELDPEHEQAGLRCLLWWSIFGETLVFRTLQEAQDYREARLKARDNKNPPTIITLDGNRLTAKGAAGGRGNRLDANVGPAYVFAARAAASSPAYQTLSQACAVLQELELRVSLLDQRRHSLQCVQQHHQSLADLRARVNHINRQLAELGGTGRGPLSPPPRAPSLRGELAELQRTAQAWHYHDNSTDPSHPTRQHSTSSNNSLGSGGSTSTRGGTHDYASRGPSPRNRDGRDGSGSTGGGGGSNRDPRMSPRGQARPTHDSNSDRRRPRDHSPRHNEAHKRHRR